MSPGARKMPSVASGPEPLWRALRSALDERGLSVREFSKLCQLRRPRKDWEQWQRTVRRALKPDAAKPYTPSPSTARLWAEIVDKPADYFVRPPTRTTERERLQARIVELEAEVRRLQGEPGHAQP